MVMYKQKRPTVFLSNHFQLVESFDLTEEANIGIPAKSKAQTWALGAIVFSLKF